MKKISLCIIIILTSFLLIPGCDWTSDSSDPADSTPCTVPTALWIIDSSAIRPIMDSVYILSSLKTENRPVYNYSAGSIDYYKIVFDTVISDPNEWVFYDMIEQYNKYHNPSAANCVPLDGWLNHEDAAVDIELRPIPASIVVTGSPSSPNVNKTYNVNSSLTNNKPQYGSSPGGNSIYFSGANEWVINETVDKRVLYRNASSSDTPPATGWTDNLGTPVNIVINSAD